MSLDAVVTNITT